MWCQTHSPNLLTFFPNLAQWTTSCPGHPCDLSSPAADYSHPRPCSAGGNTAETGFSLPVGVDFHPIVAETLGALSQDTIHLVKSLGDYISQRLNSLDSNPTTQLFHKLAVTLWHGNAALWLHCQPMLHPTVDGIIFLSIFVVTNTSSTLNFELLIDNII